MLRIINIIQIIWWIIFIWNLIPGSQTPGIQSDCLPAFAAYCRWSTGV